MKQILLTLISLFCICLFAYAQDDLPRQGNLGVSLREPSDGKAGAVVRSVESGSSAEKAGLKKDDTILRINGVFLSNASDLYQALLTVDGNTKVKLQFARNGKLQEVAFDVPPLKKESYPDIITEYSSVVTAYGYRVRTITTRPKNATGKLQAILFVRWADCDACEFPNGAKGGHEVFLQDLITKTGAVVMRVEKHGAGDSEGPSCNDADFNMELATHKAALQSLQKLDYVDNNKIIIAGQSNGAGVAPLVGEGTNVAGYMIYGGWAKTWYEHMLEIERNRFELGGDSPAEVTRKMKLVTEFYAEYLIKKQTPGKILSERPHLKDIWFWNDAYQYDMTIKYFQQLQDLNLAEAWSKVTVPVLAMFGENDWIMSKGDHERIVQLVPKLGHSFFAYPDLQTCFKNFRSGTYDPVVINTINGWMKTVIK
jgi:alpha-beta hydrolase superfamily lysophospholipase